MFPVLPQVVFIALVASLQPVPLLVDVDPVLVGIILVLLLIVFMFFLLIRRTVKSFTDGMRKGRR